MQNADRYRFDHAMDQLREDFPVGEEQFERVKNSYWRRMQDVSIGRFAKGVMKAALTQDRLPSVARMRELCGVSATDERCMECVKGGSEQAYHLKQLTKSIYEETHSHIPATLEQVYNHCRTTYERDPWIRKLVKIAICEAEGWAVTRKQPHGSGTLTPEAKNVQNHILRRGYSERELIEIGVLQHASIELPLDNRGPLLSAEENQRRAAILQRILDGEHVEREDWIHPSVFDRQAQRERATIGGDIVSYGDSHASDPYGEGKLMAYEEAETIRGEGRPWTPEERAEGLRKRKELLSRMGINKEAMEQTEKPVMAEWTAEQRREGL